MRVGWQLPPGWIQYFLPVSQEHGGHWSCCNVSLDVVYEYNGPAVFAPLDGPYHTEAHVVAPIHYLSDTHKVLDTEWTKKKTNLWRQVPSDSQRRYLSGYVAHIHGLISLMDRLGTAHWASLPYQGKFMRLSHPPPKKRICFKVPGDSQSFLEGVACFHCLTPVYQC